MLTGLASLARTIPKIFRGTRTVGIAAPPPKLKFSKETIEALNKIEVEKSNIAKQQAIQKIKDAKVRTNLSDTKDVLFKHVTKENPINWGSEARAIKVDPKYVMLGDDLGGIGPSVYRGTTLVDDPSKISTNKMMKLLKDDEKFFTTEPIEAAHHAYTHQTLDNPSVILRMAKKDAKMRPTPMVDKHKLVSNSEQAHIPVLMNIIMRLKKMGWSDAHIFKYVKQLYKDPRAKKIFNRGGIVSLVL